MNNSISQNEQYEVLVSVLVDLAYLVDLIEQRGEQSGAWQLHLLQGILIVMHDAGNVVAPWVLVVVVDGETMGNEWVLFVWLATEAESGYHFGLVVVDEYLSYW